MPRWHYDIWRSVWLCDDGRRITDQQIAEMEAFARELLLVALREASA